MILFFTIPPLFYLLARFIAHQKSNPHHGTNYKTTTTIQYYQHTHTHTMYIDIIDLYQYHFGSWETPPMGFIHLNFVPY